MTDYRYFKADYFGCINVLLSRKVPESPFDPLAGIDFNNDKNSNIIYDSSEYERNNKSIKLKKFIFYT